MIDLPWQLYLVVGIGSFGSLASASIRFLEHRSKAQLNLAQAAVHRSQAEINLVMAAGLKEEAEASRQQREREQAQTFQVDDVIRIIRAIRRA